MNTEHTNIDYDNFREPNFKSQEGNIFTYNQQKGYLMLL